LTPAAPVILHSKYSGFAWWLILDAPVVGGLVVGLMARFGSDKICGHGMPEAIEPILTRGSRIEPKVAVLKPVSAAISIGSAGIFRLITVASHR
jgi:chloride channel protein, CIC family